MNTYILVAFTAIIGVIIFLCVKTYLQIQSEFNIIHKQLSYLNNSIEQMYGYNNPKKEFSCPDGVYNINSPTSVNKYENKSEEYKQDELEVCNDTTCSIVLNTIDCIKETERDDNNNECNDTYKEVNIVDNNITDRCVNSVEGVMTGIDIENTIIEEPISDDIINLINEYKDDKEIIQENELSEMSNLADCEHSENQELNSLLMNLINTSASINNPEEQILEDNKLDNPLTETKSELETDILQTRYKLPELRELCKV